MKPAFHTFFDKLQNVRFVNRTVILSLDVILSVLATLFSYILILSLNNEWKVEGSINIVLLTSALVSFFLFITTDLYKVIIRHTTIKELSVIFCIAFIKNIVLGLLVFKITYSFDKWLVASIILDILITTFAMIGFRSMLVFCYYSIIDKSKAGSKPILLYSTMGNSPMLLEQISKDQNSDYSIKGILTTNKSKDGLYISGVKVMYVGDEYQNVDRLLEKYDIDSVLFSSRNHFDRERYNVVDILMKKSIKMLVVDKLISPNKDGVITPHINKVNIQDVLGREEIKVQTDLIEAQIKGKTVLVSGAAGSIGSEIVRQVIALEASCVICFDSAETPLHNISLEHKDMFKNSDVKIIYFLGDVRSVDTVIDIFNKYSPSIVFHAAAYKHVPMIELNPCESILTNIWGTVNIARCSIKHNVEKFVMISTDKAVNPTNVMGASKRIAEICAQHFNSLGNTKFVITRFGNVLGSNGSVIPLFEKQIAEGGPITVTDPNIVRFFMTIPEACRLVLQAATLGNGGEIFVFDMGEEMKIVDLAKKMILLSGFTPEEDIKIEFTGLRPGEKLYEEVLSNEENTIASQHSKIRIAKIESKSDSSTYYTIKRLILLARRKEVDKVIMLMKKIVPEFKSNNSEYQRFDKNC